MKSFIPLLSLSLLILSACSKKNSDESLTGGNSMETENAISARIQLADGSAAVGAIAKLCKDEIPVCATGALEKDTADVSGNVTFSSPVAGKYVIVVDFNSTHLEIFTTVSKDSETIDAGIQTLGAPGSSSQSTGARSSSSTSEIAETLPDSGIVKLNPQATTFTPVKAVAPAVSMGTSVAYSLSPFVYTDAVYTNGTGATLVAHTGETSYASSLALTLAHIDADGTIASATAYEKLGTFGNKSLTSQQEPYSTQLPSGDLIVACEVTVSGELNHPYWITKLNSSFQVQWAYLIRNKKLAFDLRSVHSGSDGSIYVSGNQAAIITDSLVPFLAKFDANGNPLWHKTYAAIGTRSTRIWNAVGIADGSILMIVNAGGGVINTIGSALLRKIDAEGNQLWETDLGWKSTSFTLNSNSDGSIITVSTLDRGNSVIRYYDNSGTQVNELSIADTKLNPQSAIDFGDQGMLLLGCVIQGAVGAYWFQAKLIRTDNKGAILWTELLGNEPDQSFYEFATPLTNGKILLVGDISHKVGDDLLWIRIRDDAP